jgi:hypothetical protein
MSIERSATARSASELARASLEESTEGSGMAREVKSKDHDSYQHLPISMTAESLDSTQIFFASAMVVSCD